MELAEPVAGGPAGPILLYDYEVAGVTYEAAQDLSALPEIAAAAPFLPGQTTSVKYDPKQPTNSILACEAWCGIPDLEPNRNAAARAQEEPAEPSVERNLINRAPQGRQDFPRIAADAVGRILPIRLRPHLLAGTADRQLLSPQVSYEQLAKMARTERRLQSDECESRFQQSRKVGGSRTIKPSRKLSSMLLRRTEPRAFWIYRFWIEERRQRHES